MTLKHLAIFTPGFADGVDDTTCIPALQIYIKALRQRRPDLAISIFAQRYPARQASGNAPYGWHGATVYPASGGQLRFPFSLRSHMRLLHSLKKATARNGPPQVIHGFFLGESAALAWLASYHCKSRLVITLMGQDARDPGRYRLLLRSPRATLVALTRWQRQLLADNNPAGPVTIIPFGTPPVTAPLPRNRDLDLLFVGNLIPIKDPLAFVRSVATLASLFPGLKAAMVGAGPLLSDIEAEIRARGLQDTLTVHGALPHSRALDMMGRARVLLHTSHCEGFGMVFAEARARGCTVVSRNVGAAADQAGPDAPPRTNSGFLTADDDAGLVAAAEAALKASPVPPSTPYPVNSTVESYLRIYGD